MLNYILENLLRCALENLLRCALCYFQECDVTKELLNTN